MSGNDALPTVVFINHWATHLGGAEYSLIDLIDALAGKARIHIFTSEYGALLDRIAPYGVECHVIASEPSLINVKRGRLISSIAANIPALTGFARYVLRLRSAVSALHPHCIHANVPKSHIALLLLQLTGVRSRCIIHFREIFSRTSAAALLYRVLYTFTGKAATVIAISNAVREALPAAMRIRAEVIYNGVTIPPSPPARSRSVPPVRFLYIGRVVPWKGCSLLIDAFLLFAERVGPDGGRLSLFGRTSYWDPAYRIALQKKITADGLADLVTLHDHTDTPYREYLEHDVLCMPSTDEPFGRAAAEAQACALPVIAFAGGGIGEIIVDRETGLVVPPADIAAFSEAMMHFTDHPADIDRMGRNGRKRATELFNRETQLLLTIRRLL